MVLDSDRMFASASLCLVQWLPTLLCFIKAHILCKHSYPPFRRLENSEMCLFRIRRVSNLP